MRLNTEWFICCKKILVLFFRIVHTWNKNNRVLFSPKTKQKTKLNKYETKPADVMSRFLSQRTYAVIKQV